MTFKKIFISHASSSNFRKELYEPVINCEEIWDEYEVILPQFDSEPEPNVDSLFREGKIILFAEISTPSHGVGIELGLAHAFRSGPIYAFHKKGTTYSRAILYTTVHIIEYTNSADMIEKMKSILHSL